MLCIWEARKLAGLILFVAYNSALKMEAICSSEAPRYFLIAQHPNAEDCVLRSILVTISNPKNSLSFLVGYLVTLSVSNRRMTDESEGIWKEVAVA
jgi:hypothetical protein